MTRGTILAGLAVLALSSSHAEAKPAATADLVRARQLFFGAENVDARTGHVDEQKVIFSWITNASFAVSVKGRIVLLDSFIHRPETVPGRTPFVVEDLVSLSPEAIFLGHGHGDHADNAAFIAGSLGIPIFASAETCVAMQGDAARFFAAGNIPVSTVECHDVTTFGSTPGAEVVRLRQLEPAACITAFRHLHSTTVPANLLELSPGFETIVPINNIADPRDAALYPPGTAHSFTTQARDGGPISILYQFVLRGDNRFTFLWHNTTGAIREGCGLDKCWGKDVGVRVTNLLQSLPPTDIEFGSMVSLGFPKTGMRDPILYQLALHPKIYVPIHQTNAALPTSSLEFKTSYLKQLDVSKIAAADRPEPRWMVDPNEYVKPLVFDPKDDRWRKPGGRDGKGMCGGDDRD
jgi:hypothetical protein